MRATIGGPGEIRTPDRVLRTDPLYPPELRSLQRMLMRQRQRRVETPAPRLAPPGATAGRFGPGRLPGLKPGRLRRPRHPRPQGRANRLRRQRRLWRPHDPVRRSHRLIGIDAPRGDPKLAEASRAGLERLALHSPARTARRAPPGGHRPRRQRQPERNRRPRALVRSNRRRPLGLGARSAAARGPGAASHPQRRRRSRRRPAGRRIRRP